MAATGATTVANGQQLHYLRTTNPFNPENLAVYPRRLGTNRPNAYTKPNAFDKLATGLESYETRQCGRPLPLLTNTPSPVGTATLPDLSLPVTVPPSPPWTEGVVNGLFSYTDQLFADIQRFGFNGVTGRTGPAPPCRQQGPFTVQGETSQYPHVKPAG